jgi:hypothetical protein
MKETAAGTMTLAVVAMIRKERENETLKGMSFQETREKRMKN